MLCRRTPGELEFFKVPFIRLLEQFALNEIKILEDSEYVSDDEYLRSIEGMVQSIENARKEPNENGVPLDKLDW